MPRRTRRPSLAGAAFVVAALAVMAGPAAAAGSTPHRVVIYSKTTREEFNNHSDDRIRGDLNNPFGKTTSAATAGGLIGHGPFAGDRAIFTFDLYSDSGLNHSIGSAVFSCQYGFGKHGICQAEYDFGGGTMLGLGYLDFNATTFALALTGGTGKYQHAKGDVVVSPDGKKRGNKLLFTLT